MLILFEDDHVHDADKAMNEKKLEKILIYKMKNNIISFECFLAKFRIFSPIHALKVECNC